MNLTVTIGSLIYNFVIIAVCSLIIILKRKLQSHEEEDFLFGGKRTGWFACAASMALGVLGGGHVNGLPASSWDVGFAAIFFCIGCGCFFLFVMRYTGVWYRRTGCSTVNELFGKMFHPALAPILSGVGVGYSWLVLCAETQSMGTVIATATGISLPVGCMIGAALGILYVLLAGQQEVALVNSVNAVLMYVFGIIVLIFIGFKCVGGWTAVNDTILSSNPALLHVLGNKDIIRTYTIGTFLACALGMNFLQGNIQPCCTVPKVNTLRKACIAAIPMNVMFGVIVISMGIAAKSLVDRGLMVAPNGAVGAVQLLLDFMPNWLQIGVIGMFLAAMLSTFAMLALSISMMINRNILINFPFYKKLSRNTENWLSRLWIFVFSVAAAFVSVGVTGQVSAALAWGWAWFIPLFIMFIIGMQWKRSKWGSVITLLICWITNCVLSFTPLAANLGLEGNNNSIFMTVFAIFFGVILTAIDKKAGVSYRKVYDLQRARYDANRLSKKGA